MAEQTEIYQNPLCGRYASYEMNHLFSADVKFSTWRMLWVALAKAEQKLGLNITDRQIGELKLHVNDINYDVANEREKITRHDVMSHVYAYGQQCPNAAGIIHLGATSCYVTDNTDIILISKGLELIRKKLIGTIKFLADFAEQYKDQPTLGYTHFQEASLVTVGKRATLWLQNFMENLEELKFVQSNLKMLGCRGATGTSETFMKLFDGNEEKIKKLDTLIAEEFGFEKVYPVSGQTYPRNLDIRVINVLSAISVSAHKMAKDIRLLQHEKEIEEPFETSQIGSSAMAYKRNPMRCERICSLARFVENLVGNPIATAEDQWLERTLDDSANRRITIPEAFLATDSILIICANVTNGLVVNTKVIEKHMNAELPFMVTEDILMKAVQKGGDRQKLHEKIRVYSMEAGNRVKQEGKDNNLVQLIANDADFGMTVDEIYDIMDPKKLTGRSAGQVTDYLRSYVYPVLAENQMYLNNIDTNVTV